MTTVTLTANAHDSTWKWHVTYGGYQRNGWAYTLRAASREARRTLRQMDRAGRKVFVTPKVDEQ